MTTKGRGLLRFLLVGNGPCRAVGDTPGRSARHRAHVSPPQFLSPGTEVTRDADIVGAALGIGGERANDTPETQQVPPREQTAGIISEGPAGTHSVADGVGGGCSIPSQRPLKRRWPCLSVGEIPPCFEGVSRLMHVTYGLVLSLALLCDNPSLGARSGPRTPERNRLHTEPERLVGELPHPPGGTAVASPAGSLGDPNGTHDSPDGTEGAACRLPPSGPRGPTAGCDSER